MQKIQVQCHRLEKDNQQLMSDLGKANEIIQRKMEENRTFKDKYRRNTELIKKQEKLLQDKDEDIKVNIFMVINFHQCTIIKYLTNQIFYLSRHN